MGVTRSLWRAEPPPPILGSGYFWCHFSPVLSPAPRTGERNFLLTYTCSSFLIVSPGAAFKHNRRGLSIYFRNSIFLWFMTCFKDQKLAWQVPLLWSLHTSVGTSLKSHREGTFWSCFKNYLNFHGNQALWSHCHVLGLFPLKGLLEKSVLPQQPLNNGDGLPATLPSLSFPACPFPIPLLPLKTIVWKQGTPVQCSVVILPPQERWGLVTMAGGDLRVSGSQPVSGLYSLNSSHMSEQSVLEETGHPGRHQAVEKWFILNEISNHLPYTQPRHRTKTRPRCLC